MFSTFAPARERLLLRNERFLVEVWPEAGGGVARFDHIETAPRALFRRTVEKAELRPIDLSCWPLLPYSNRIAQGCFSFHGETFRIPPHEASFPHALHGVGWQSCWRTIDPATTTCRLALEHMADARWPFDFAASQSFALDDSGLTIVTALVNRDDRPMPFGLGQHPYVARPRGTRLFASVDAVWSIDETSLPVERVPLPEGWDLRKGCLLDAAVIDNCFEPFRGSVTVVWPDGGALIMECSDNLRRLVVYNPAGEDFVCIEPVTHMPDAFNRDASPDCLPPGGGAQVAHRFIYRAPACRP